MSIVKWLSYIPMFVNVEKETDLIIILSKQICFNALFLERCDWTNYLIYELDHGMYES